MATDANELLFPPKEAAPLHIYAWSLNTPPSGYVGLLKIGQTTRPDVNDRIKESQGQVPQPYTLHVDEIGQRDDGTLFRDSDVRRHLVDKGFENPTIDSAKEWIRCTPEDVKTAIAEIRAGKTFTGTHHETFTMRPEQRAAVDATFAYYQSMWAENSAHVPRFLWNAKMRFGKTFAAYQLASKLEAKRILVLTFKPAVEDAWHHDLSSHVDFSGWIFATAKNDLHISDVDEDTPLVYFGSFQDLMGKDLNTGVYKAKNAWIRDTSWDLVIFDEYHFGAWRESVKELFEGEDKDVKKREIEAEFNSSLNSFEEELDELSSHEAEFLPIATRAYLYLSGTPFKALATGEFIEEQIFNWTYSDEQHAKRQFSLEYPDSWNPYGALPEMRLLTYQMPDELIAVARQGEFDEFDLNTFFSAKGRGAKASFDHKDDVQKWLDIIRGSYTPTQLAAQKAGGRPPFPYSDVRILPYMQHSLWFLPDVSACHAMANLLAEKQNTYWHQFTVLAVAGPGAGIGPKALPPVRKAIGDGNTTRTITLTCGKLTTGVTVKEWSSILMLRNLSSPETYFQAAFRVQSPWSIKNPHGDDPSEEAVIKPVCFVFDFAPTRALRQISDYAIRLSPDASTPEAAVEDLLAFLPVLSYDGLSMEARDAGAILDHAIAGTSATLLARKWESALLVNVDNATLKRVMNDADAFAAVMNIEGFRALGSSTFETVVNQSEALKTTRREKGDSLTDKQHKELSEEEKEVKQLRGKIREKLIKFAARIPAFMYLTDYRENTLQDVITKIEPTLFKRVTGLTVADFELLVSLNVFNSTYMNEAVFAFRRYEEASLSYTGIPSHPNLTQIGGYDTVTEAKAL